MIPSAMPAALDDIRVLDLADEKGQYCGKLLADMGADVIKVEPPGGDPARRIGPFVDDIPHPDRSLFFWHYNTNKRGITSNLDTPEGRDLFRRLVATADIVIETFSPGHLDGLGLGYAALSEARPDLIVASITPFGQWGPFRDYMAGDLVTLALGGPMGVSGYSRNENGVYDTPPIRGTGYQGQHISSHYAAVSTLIALEARYTIGGGQHVDVSMHDCAAVCTETPVPAYLTSGEVAQRQTGRHATINPSGPSTYPTRDGGYVNFVVGGMTPEAFAKTVEWLDSQGAAEDLTDPLYLDSEYLGSRMQHVMGVLGRFVATQDMRAVWRAAQEVGQTWGPINSPEDLVDDPHLRDRGFFHELHHPELGRTITYPGEPYLLSGTPWSLRRRAPLVGEHNEELYCRELGLSKHDLTVLAAVRAI